MKTAFLLLLLTNLYPIELKTVHDGDTITATVIMDFDVAIYSKPIRFHGFDAWELSKQRRTVNVTDEEIVKGKLAKEYLIKLIGTSKLYLEPKESGYDKYGRILGVVYVLKDNKLESLSELMIKAGHQRK